MAQISYIRNGYVYIPSLEVNRSGLVGGPVVTIATNTGLAPAVTGAIILDSIVLPAGTFDTPGQYLTIEAMAVTVSSANTKTLAINFGGTGSIGGAVTGGTTIITNSVTTSTFVAENATIIKTGANAQAFITDVATSTAATRSAAVGTATVTDSGSVQLNLVVNAVTAASDITSVLWIVQFGM